MRILVLNSGSSSLKFSLMEMATPEPDRERTGRQDILNGSVKGIGGKATLDWHDHQSHALSVSRIIPDHASAVQWLFEHLTREEVGTFSHSVDAVGHRIVHGGERLFIQRCMMSIAGL